MNTRKQSIRRMIVAQKRRQRREDVLQRRPVRYRWPKRRPLLILEDFTPNDAIALIDYLLTNEVKQ